ncbi:hypothetical protein DFH07DRAFT_959157 [Mycena maculata]|uniref:Uncharacterized protein n=1 Tax=Mycena maculata TaxID=230809 RepID=A0AAD7NDM9_9AGAR|nr:hypothetical protein DFH07DRAFT_959157 [Mycena maculata]
MSNVNSPEAEDSPHKASCTSGTDDAPSRLPDFRTHSKRPSPGPNRKLPGSGVPGNRVPRLDRGENVFLAGANTSGRGNLALGTHNGTPRNSRRRESLLRSQSVSPTPSPRAYRNPEGLDMGHRSDLEASDLGEGQILEAHQGPLETAVAGYDGDLEDTVPEGTGAPQNDTAPAHTPAEDVQNQTPQAQLTPAQPTPTVAAENEEANAQTADPQRVQKETRNTDAHGTDAPADTVHTPAHVADVTAQAEQDTAMTDAPNAVVGDVLAAMAIDDPAPAYEPAQAHNHNHNGPFLAPMHPAAPGPAAAAEAPLHPNDPRVRGPGHVFIFANDEQAAAHAEVLANPAPAMEDIQEASVAPGAAPQLFVPHLVVVPAAVPAAAQAAIAGAAAALGPAVAATVAAIEVLAAAKPTHRDENPHKKVPAVVEQDPAGPEDLNKLDMVQRNVGNFDELVMSFTKATGNARKEILAEIINNPENHTALVPFNGGKAHQIALPDFPQTATMLLESIVGKGKAFVIPVPPEDPTYGAATGNKALNTYTGPLMLGVQFADADARTKAIAHHVYASASTARPPSTVHLDGVNRRWLALRFAIIVIFLEDATLRRLVDQATSATDRRPLADRTLSIAETIDPQWSPLMKAWVVYVKPCMTNEAVWLKITDHLARKTFVKGYYAFKPVAEVRASGPRCVLCKNDMHYAADPEWWGPPGQISTLTEGPLAPKKNTGAGNGRRGFHGNG